ncbi:MAG: GNAT family N-acetyltransferase [Roseibium sp.]|uniref:GNAT family N-acetyltransferase n=1 Tax=Roseibium sp. TaxID=1936156 RepID=UPI001B07E06B|nr:GNAT family N-acetyltransferase [Roseibium sp.]MBO6890493.1 GNAT family N-acetyltransferase [Roseibium sp.]MBO6931621.1 GNAT family N-acetyltransferase [Roseibium sp.]
MRSGLGLAQERAKTAALGLVPGWHDQPTLGQLKSLWSGLSGGAVCTPFQSVEFVHAFFEKIAPVNCERVAIFALHDEVTREPVLLLPLVWYRKGPFRIVTTPDLGLADQNGPVFSKRLLESPGNIHDALVGALMQSLTDCDVLKICKIHPRISGIANPLFDAAEAYPEGQTLYLDADALAQVDGQSKKSVYKEARTKFRKLGREEVSLVEVEASQERQRVCAILLEQRRKRLEELGDPDPEDEDHRDRFYQYLATLSGENGPVTMLALQKGEEIVAAVVLLANGTSANGVLVSIGDPRWHRMSPGMVLFVKSMEWAREHNIQNFSLGAGLHSYKNRFGASMLETKRILIPTNMRGRTFVTALHAKKISQALYEKTVSEG